MRLPNYIRWQFQRLVSVFGQLRLKKSNQSLTPVEKLCYLQASLPGSAAATVNGLSLSSANNNAAGVLLKERYGDVQKIISIHIDGLVNLPIVENARDLKALRHLYDEVEASVRALRSQGRRIWRSLAFLDVSQNTRRNQIKLL